MSPELKGTAEQKARALDDIYGYLCFAVQTNPIVKEVVKELRQMVVDKLNYNIKHDYEDMLYDKYDKLKEELDKKFSPESPEYSKEHWELFAQHMNELKNLDELVKPELNQYW